MEIITNLAQAEDGVRTELGNMSRPKSSFWTLPKPPQKHSFQLEPQIIVTAYDPDPTIPEAYVSVFIILF